MLYYKLNDNKINSLQTYIIFVQPETSCKIPSLSHNTPVMAIMVIMVMQMYISVVVDDRTEMALPKLTFGLIYIIKFGLVKSVNPIG